jgi:hypothetical protein
VAEDGSKNGRSELPELSLEVWKKGPIYSCRAHIATSFVLVAIVVREEIAEKIRRFQECEEADPGGARVRLVVSSSCTVVRCQFLGRTVRMVVRWVFRVVAPQMHGRSMVTRARMCGCNGQSHVQGGMLFGKIGMHGVRACPKGACLWA